MRENNETQILKKSRIERYEMIGKKAKPHYWMPVQSHTYKHQS